MSEEECVRACDQDCRVTSFLKKMRIFKRHPGHDPWDTILLKQEMRINLQCVCYFSSLVIFVNLIKAFIYKKLYSILKIHHCQCFILCIIILTFSLLRFSLIDCKLFAVILTPV